MAQAKRIVPNASIKKLNAEDETHQGIDYIDVTGFKSICETQSIEIRPLTILAGANSSGKSSIMQPLLLLKQTYEANFDPGPLLLIGEHVKFTSNDQILCRVKNAKQPRGFQISVKSKESVFEISFIDKNERFVIDSWMIRLADQDLLIKPGQEFYNTAHRKFIKDSGYDSDEYFKILERINPFKAIIGQKSGLPILINETPKNNISDALRNIKNSPDINDESRKKILSLINRQQDLHKSGPAILGEEIVSQILKIVHLPVVRGNKERAYPVAAIGNRFTGPFPVYTASIIESWQQKKDLKKLNGLFADMRLLGLTSKVIAKRINGAQLEVLVSRLVGREPRLKSDFVNLVDVGFGVNQVLPVLVALHAAEPGRLVYIEQPENDLHPRAQVALAQVLASAAQRGVRLVVETHSSLLLLGIQTLVAEGKMKPDLVKLHWFSRDKRGITKISSSDVDSTGAFAEKWPADFSEIELQAQVRFLNATDLKNTSLAKIRPKTKKISRG